MPSSPNRTHFINSDSQGEDEDEDEQHEDDVRTVENVISLCQANKITKSNVWKYELIDKLAILIKHHNAYIRNFQNIGRSLDATMKIYEVRVDSVCNDVRRLGLGIAPAESTQGVRSRRKSSQPNPENELDTNTSGKASRQSRKKRRFHANVSGNLQQMNAPLQLIAVPDGLISKLNTINIDIAASNRLFSSVLPTKNSFIRLISDEKFIECGDYVAAIEFNGDFEYECADQDFFTMPFNLQFAASLPIRQDGNGLSGYQIQDTAFVEQYYEDKSMMEAESDFAPDFAPEFAFDPDIDDSIWPNQQMVSQQNNDEELISNKSVGQDLNNNNDNGTPHFAEPLPENNNIRKGEYSYHTHIRNFKYGPSYWKFLRQHRSTVEPRPRGKRGGRKVEEKPSFIDCADEAQISDNEYFIKTSSRVAKRIRECNYRRWSPEKLKLPTHSDIPRNLFESYAFKPSFDIFKNLESQGNVQAEADAPHNPTEEFDFAQMDNGLMNSTPIESHSQQDGYEFQHEEDADLNHYEQNDGSIVNISEHVEDLPQVIEKIHINFEKRAKVVNMARLNKSTLWSIDRQLLHSAINGSPCTINVAEEFEPGKAIFSKVFKDLVVNKGRFMASESELTTGLALFSVLTAVNNERLRLSSKPNLNNDFEIFQLKKRV